MKKANKKMTRLILAALLCTGGGQIYASPVGYAQSTTIDASVGTGADVLVVGNNDGSDLSTPSGDASNNTVTMTGGTVGSISGGDGGTGPGTATDANGNTVTVSGGTIKGNVTGGSVAADGKSASNNTITISGTAQFENPDMGLAAIYAGQSYGAGGTASNNTVNILVPVTIAGEIMGGDVMDGGTSSNNTLNIAAVGVNAGNIYGFQNINFFLPSTTVAGATMLNVTGTALVTDTTFGVAAQSGLTSLSKGDSVTLLKAQTLTADDTLKTTTDLKVPTGITTSTNYEFEITKSGTDSIIATVTKADDEGSQELSKSPVETRAATTTFINSGADILASQGFAQAANAVALETAAQAKNGTPAQQLKGFTPFAAFGGSSLRAKSGSHVDTKGFGLNVGFAREIPNKHGKLLFGPIVEYGGGNYASHLDNGTRGDGKSHYFGIGVMARQINNSGLYYEGSLRGGRADSDYKSVINNQTVDYDSSSNYFAAHAGIGKVFSLGGNNTLDGYLKYFYSHQGGDDVTIHGSTTGDESWDFDTVNSHRVRIGARLTHKVNERNSFYGGLAYQYEFDGEARAHYNGNGTPSPSIKGSSGMLELGWQVKPGGPLTLDLGVTGWAGKQRGASVQLGATWSF